MKKLLFFAVLLCLVSGPVFAASDHDVTGIWSGVGTGVEPTGQTELYSATLTITQQVGPVFSGTCTTIAGGGQEDWLVTGNINATTKEIRAIATDSGKTKTVLIGGQLNGTSRMGCVWQDLKDGSTAKIPMIKTQ